MRQIHKSMLEMGEFDIDWSHDPANRLADAKELVAVGFLTVFKTDGVHRFRVTPEGREVAKVL